MCIPQCVCVVFGFPDCQPVAFRWRNCFTEPTPPNYDTRWTIVLMFVAAMFLCRFQVPSTSLYFISLSQSHRQNLVVSQLYQSEQRLALQPTFTRSGPCTSFADLRCCSATIIRHFHIIQVWMSRQTLALADHFFPDRIRPRALMLYNRILQDRKNVLGAMMDEQKVRF